MSGPTLPAGGDVRCPHCREEHPASYTHCPKTGRSLSVGHALIGKVIAGRYRITGELGLGGMGEVFIAEHLLIGRKVAIKRLHPELAADERAVQRFQREARAAAATGHEHIVEVLDLGYADDGAPYLVMEYLRGLSLAELLRKEARLEPVRVAILMGQVLAALDAVHALEIVHRDLKPDNVFVTRRPGVGEFVKVLDFGISKMKEESGESLHLTRTGMMMGTPFYLSPEQARGMVDLDHRVDLYAVGVMLYECLTGRLPFASDNYHALLQQILRTEPKRPSELVKGIEPELDAIVMRAIGKQASSRYQTAAEFLQALEPWGAAAPSDGQSYRPPAPVLEPLTTSREASVEGLRRMTPRYFFAASDDWLPERARSGAIRPPLAVSQLRDPSPPGASLTGANPTGATTAERRRRASPTEGLPSPGGGTGSPPTGTPSVGAVSPSAVSPSAVSPSAGTPSAGSQSARNSPTQGMPASAVRAPTAGTPTAMVESPLGPTPGSTQTLPGPGALRGSWFVATLEHLEGTGRFDEVLSRLSAPLSDRIRGVIVPMAWMPLSSFDALVRAVGTDQGTLTSIGRAIAERELKTAHRLMLETATPQSSLERFPQLFKLYHLRGQATLESGIGAGAFRLTLDAGIPEPLAHVVVVAAFVERMLELSGAAEAKVSVTSCRGRGDDTTVLACRLGERRP